MSSGLIALILLGLFFLVLFPKLRGHNSAFRITGAQAREKVEKGATLIDVRTPQEFSQTHLKGAKNIPLQELSTRLKELPKGELILYCRSGMRSQKALQILHKEGLEESYDLGPLSAWNK